MFTRLLCFAALLTLAACGTRDDEFADAWKWTCYDEFSHSLVEGDDDLYAGRTRANNSVAAQMLRAARSSR